MEGIHEYATRHRRSEVRQGAWWALIVLFLVGLTNYFDRLSLGVLQVPIKAELGFTDAQLGMLTGLAFFLPYTLLSIPAARLADRGNRKQVLLYALVVWSVMTASISASSGFMLMLILRAGVAIGEAACLPATYSMLSDYFAPHRRARAIAIYASSVPLGSMLGIMSIGAMESALGWRATFLVLGCMGLLIFPLMYFTVDEPRRGTFDTDATLQEAAPLRQVIAEIAGNRAMRWMALGLGLQSYVAITVYSWITPFYTREHGLSLIDAALIIGPITGIGGALGSYLGGSISDRIGQRSIRAYCWVPGIFALFTIPLGLIQFLAADATQSFVAGAMVMVCITAYIPPVYAVAQTLVSSRSRALVSALLVMSASLLGGVWGPTVTGLLSEAYLASGLNSADALQRALISGLAFSLLSCGCFFRASGALPDISISSFSERGKV